jgi:hypothetical protein
MSREFLFVLWAGGGNVPPQLAIARRMVARGHRVRMLAPAVLRESIEAAGIVFEPYREVPEHDESVPERSLVRDFGARSKLAAAAAARDNLVAAMARPVAADVLTTLERRPSTKPIPSSTIINKTPIGRAMTYQAKWRFAARTPVSLSRLPMPLLRVATGREGDWQAVPPPGRSTTGQAIPSHVLG